MKKSFFSLLILAIVLIAGMGYSSCAPPDGTVKTEQCIIENFDYPAIGAPEITVNSIAITPVGCSQENTIISEFQSPIMVNNSRATLQTCSGYSGMELQQTLINEQGAIAQTNNEYADFPEVMSRSGVIQGTSIYIFSDLPAKTDKKHTHIVD